MPWPRILSRYVVREVLLYAALGGVAITLVFVSEKLLRFGDDLVAGGFTPGEILTLLRCSAISVLVYSAPAAFLFGVLLASGRLAADREITAMRSCGLGLRDILRPVTALGLALSCVLVILALDVQHRSRRELHRLTGSVAARRAMLEPGRFEQVGERVLYVDRRLSDDRLEGVVIADRSHAERPVMIFAERGRLVWDDDRSELHLRLHDGEIHFERDAERDTRDEAAYERISFARFDTSFPVAASSGLPFGRLRPSEMTMAELRAVAARARSGETLEDLREPNPIGYGLEIHRRFALPAAPVLFALVGVPLGLRRVRGARSRGVLVCALLGLVYYVILSFSQLLALASLLPAAVAVWTPNAAFGLVAAVLIGRARSGDAPAT
jgi:lipopolysaccharide export system permease protein